MTVLFAILTENASFRSYGTFAYLLRAHIRNINMCRYIASASARGRELSGRVRADAYNFAVLYMLWTGALRIKACDIESVRARARAHIASRSRTRVLLDERRGTQRSEFNRSTFFWCCIAKTVRNMLWLH